MKCKQAQQLFDAYLDGELSDSLATELGAHRVHCAECRRALALMEVSGHIIGSDGETPELSASFTDRLLACMEEPRNRSLVHQLWRWRYVAGPLAAAAVVTFAIIMPMNNDRPNRVMGLEEGAVLPLTVDGTDLGDATNTKLDEFARRLQDDVRSTKRSRNSLEQAINLPAARLLDLLKEERQPTEQADADTPTNTEAVSADSSRETGNQADANGD